MNCPKCLSALPDDSEFCSFCGEKIIDAVADEEIIKQAKKRIREAKIKKFKGKSKVFINIAIVEAVIIIAIGIYSFTTVYTLKETVHDRDIAIRSLNDKLNDSRGEIDSLKAELSTEKLLNISDKTKANFLDEHIAFVTENSNYYHSYDCEQFIGDFWAYNTEAAKSEGYKPCPKCH